MSQHIRPIHTCLDLSHNEHPFLHIARYFEMIVPILIDGQMVQNLHIVTQT
jgi:hypothetical protein